MALEPRRGGTDPLYLRRRYDCFPVGREASFSQGTLTTDSRNSRTVYAEFGTDRGQIIVGGDAIADSVASDDAYAYQRTYPQGELYAPITGYFSTYFMTSILCITDF